MLLRICARAHRSASVGLSVPHGRRCPCSTAARVLFFGSDDVSLPSLQMLHGLMKERATTHENGDSKSVGIHGANTEGIAVDRLEVVVPPSPAHSSLCTCCRAPPPSTRTSQLPLCGGECVNRLASAAMSADDWQ